MSNPWFRVYAEIIDDPVLMFLAPGDQRNFIWVLAMKCGGLLDKSYPQPDMLDKVVAWKLGLDQGEALRNAKRRLIEVGLIGEDWQPTNWDKRQFISDLKDPTAAERMRRHRAKQNEDRNAAVTHRNDTVTLRPPESDTDTDIRTTEDSSYVGQTPDATPLEVQKPETQKTRELKASATRLLDWLNSKTGRAYKPLAVNLDPIIARLKEGASEVQIKTVISVKAREWGTDEKMAQYLRPATLFNRTKFWQYHGAIPFQPRNQEATT